jgi:hypothetical protein
LGDGEVAAEVAAVGLVWVVEAEVAHPASAATAIPLAIMRPALDIIRVLPRRERSVPYARQPPARLHKSPRNNTSRVADARSHGATSGALWTVKGQRSGVRRRARTASLRSAGPDDHRHHQVMIHRWGWTLVLNPDGTTTAWNPDRTKVLHSHGPPARAG